VCQNVGNVYCLNNRKYNLIGSHGITLQRNSQPPLYERNVFFFNIFLPFQVGWFPCLCYSWSRASASYHLVETSWMCLVYWMLWRERSQTTNGKVRRSSDPFGCDRNELQPSLCGGLTTLASTVQISSVRGAVRVGLFVLCEFSSAQTYSIENLSV
jgi:hypothetical protein